MIICSWQLLDVGATYGCILGQVLYLIVSIPDLCRLSYFNTFSLSFQVIVLLVHSNGNDHIQNFLLGRYIVGYMVGNLVLWRRAIYLLKHCLLLFVSLCFLSCGDNLCKQSESRSGPTDRRSRLWIGTIYHSYSAPERYFEKLILEKVSR